MTYKGKTTDGFVSLLMLGLIVLVLLSFVLLAVLRGALTIGGVNFGNNDKVANTGSPVVDQSKLKQYRLEGKSLSKDPSTGEVATTQDAVVDDVAAKGEKFVLHLSEGIVVSAIATKQTVVGRVTSYDFDARGGIAGLSIGSATYDELESINKGDVIRVSYVEGPEKNTVNLKKVVIYLKK